MARPAPSSPRQRRRLFPSNAPDPAQVAHSSHGNGAYLRKNPCLCLPSHSSDSHRSLLASSCNSAAHARLSCSGSKEEIGYIHPHQGIAIKGLHYWSLLWYLVTPVRPCSPLYDVVPQKMQSYIPNERCSHRICRKDWELGSFKTAPLIWTISSRQFRHFRRAFRLVGATGPHPVLCLEYQAQPKYRVVNLMPTRLRVFWCVHA